MVRVFTSFVINAPIDNVWMKIRDFNALPNWHPAIANSFIEDGEPSDKVNCIRHFNLKVRGYYSRKAIGSQRLRLFILLLNSRITHALKELCGNIAA